MNFNASFLTKYLSSSQGWLNAHAAGKPANLGQYTPQFVAGKMGNAEQAKVAFEHIDQNDDNVIDVREITANMYAADADGNGEITEQERINYGQALAANNPALLSKLVAALAFVSGVSPKTLAQQSLNQMVSMADGKIDQAEGQFRAILQEHIRKNPQAAPLLSKEFNLTQAEKDAINGPVNNLPDNATPDQVQAALTASRNALDAALNKRESVNSAVPSDRGNPNGSRSTGYKETYNDLVAKRGKDDMGMAGIVAYAPDDNPDWVAFSFDFDAGPVPKVNIVPVSSAQQATDVVDVNTFDPSFYTNPGAHLSQLYKDGVEDFKKQLNKFLGKPADFNPFDANENLGWSNSTDANTLKAGMDALIAKYKAKYEDKDASDGTTRLLNFTFKHPTVVVNPEQKGSDAIAPGTGFPDILNKLRDTIKTVSGNANFNWAADDQALVNIVNNNNATAADRNKALQDLAVKYSSKLDTGNNWVDGPNGTKVNKNFEFVFRPITSQVTNQTAPVPTSPTDPNATLQTMDQMINQLLGPDAGKFDITQTNNFPNAADNTALTNLINQVRAAYQGGQTAAINTALTNLVNFLNEKLDTTVGKDVQIKLDPLKDGPPVTTDGKLSKTGTSADETLDQLSLALRDVFGTAVGDDIDLRDGVRAGGAITQAEADAINGKIQAVRQAYATLNSQGGGYDQINTAIQSLVQDLNTAYDVTGNRDIQLQFTPIKAGTAIYNDMGKLFNPNFSYDPSRPAGSLGNSGTFNGIDPTQADWSDKLIQAFPERYLVQAQGDFDGDGRKGTDIDTAIVAKLRTMHDASMNPEYKTIQINATRAEYDAQGRPTGKFRTMLESMGLNPDTIDKNNVVTVVDDRNDNNTGNDNPNTWLLVKTSDLMPPANTKAGQIFSNRPQSQTIDRQGRPDLSLSYGYTDINGFLGVGPDGKPLPASQVLGSAWLQGKTVQQIGGFDNYLLTEGEMNQVDGLGDDAYFGRTTEANRLELDNGLPHHYQTLAINGQPGSLRQNPLWMNGSFYLSGSGRNTFLEPNDCEWMVPPVTPGGFVAKKVETPKVPGAISSTLTTNNPGYIDYSQKSITKTPGELKGDVKTQTESIEITPPNPTVKKNEWTLMTPLMLDINGTGIDLTSAEDGVKFDIDGDGDLDQVSWTAANGADTTGILGLDLNGNGLIDSGLELFGSQHGDDNGFKRLSKYDSNKDGKIDASDAIYRTLKIWQDMNHDGISQANEQLTLDEAGVASINVGYTESSETDEHGNGLFQQGSFTRTQEKLNQLAAAGRPTSLLGFILDAWLKTLK